MGKILMSNRVHNNEEGFVLVVSLMILVVLTILGTLATTTTDIELNIAGNDKLEKQTFYRADGATEVGAELVEQNVACPTGFKSAPSGFDDTDPATFFSLSGVDVFDKLFAFDETMSDIAHTGSPVLLKDLPNFYIRSLRIPSDLTNRDTVPVTNLAIWGETELAAGSAIQMAQGYEGKAKSAAAGGAYIAYEIHAQHQGLSNSESIVRLDWRHLVGFEGTCIY